jgi:hypothetical protein
MVYLLFHKSAQLSHHEVGDGGRLRFGGLRRMSDVPD